MQLLAVGSKMALLIQNALLRGESLREQQGQEVGEISQVCADRFWWGATCCIDMQQGLVTSVYIVAYSPSERRSPPSLFAISYIARANDCTTRGRI